MTEKTLKNQNKNAKKRFRILIAITSVFMLLVSALYLGFSWNKYREAASSEAITLAQSLESMLHSEHITALSGDSSDLQKAEYNMMKNNLMQLVRNNNKIRFAYIMAQKNGNIIFLLDSESPESPDYSVPGQIYGEADNYTKESFRSEKTILTDPSSDRWGTWVSALVPIKDANGSTIAVFGLDYPADDWNTLIWEQMIPDILIVVSIFTMMIALLNSRFQSFKLRELSDKLALDEALYRGVFDQAPIGISIVNDKNFVTQSEFGNSNTNPLFEKILGRTSRELEQIKWPDITHPDDLEADLENFERFKAGEIAGYSIEKRFIRPDGSYVWTNMKISALLASDRKNSSHLCLLEDISDRKMTEKSLKESERSKSVFLSNLPGMAYRCNYDRDWTMQFVSDGCYDLTGYTPEQLLYNRDLSFNNLIAPEYQELLWEEWSRILSLKHPFRYEYEITTAAGERKWVLEMGQGVYDEQGEVEALEGIILDISASKEIEDIFKYNSEHDPWTGLYNRRYLEILLLEDAKRSFKKRALVSVNLSAVHSLNLKFGFQYSQELIKKAARVLETLCTAYIQLFITYENRFVFYIKSYRDKEELTAFCEKVVGKLKSILSVEKIGAGVGVIEIDEDNKNDVGLLQKNLLVASEKAINVTEPEIGVCFFDRQMASQLIREDTIGHELGHIASGENTDGLFLHFQPVLDLRSNQICGFEALARMRSDELGVIAPAEFIQIAEKTNLIIPIGYQIIRKALRFLNRLKQNGYENVSVSVNISAIQLMKNDFTDTLFEIIDEMHANAQNIGIEITESVFVANHDDINRILNELESAGIKVAIDDFGQGYSSLARERELNVNYLKIDKCFIDKLMELEDHEAITGDIISMGHRLGHCVIAEGVEHERQMRYLIEHNCDKVQGYLIGRPLGEEAALDFLKNHNTTPCVYNAEVTPNEGLNTKIETLESYQDQLKLILDSTAEAIFGLDLNGYCTFCNTSCIHLLGYRSQRDLLGKKMHEQIHYQRKDGSPFTAKDCKICRSIKQGKGYQSDDEVFWRADGTCFDVEYHSYPQIKNGKVVGAVITFMDITEKKQKEAEIEYLYCHDVLTGLYNRRCLDEHREKTDVAKNLPLSVIFADINGLKLTNDIFGHAAGDALIKKSAEIILQSCREKDVVARVGGDEFIILLPKTAKKDAEKILSRIKSGFSDTRVEAVKCSVSVGSDTKTEAQQSLEIIIANAENAMYRDKTMNRENINKDMIDTILETLHTRSPNERRHSIAVSKMCGDFGASLGLPEPEIDRLKRIGYLHDIGKIILDETILNKDDDLTPEELEKIKQHPVVGYRILNLFDDTLDLADYIYSHHERWDGSGFPRGLKGEKIPLISRILIIAETYERVLGKKSIPESERPQTALETIKKYAGTRFDPQIAAVFIKMMESQN